MASKRKQAAQAAATAPRAVYPPTFSFFFSFPPIFAMAALPVITMAYLSGDISPLRAFLGYVMMAPAFAVYVRRYLLPADRALFNKKQRERLLFTQEVSVSLPLLFLNFETTRWGRWTPTGPAYNWLLLMNGLATLYVVLNWLAARKLELKRAEAKDPLGML